ncbi:hypothetical protein B6U90_07365, partial [Thermoplasmatales archaeon ex4484_6]
MSKMAIIGGILAVLAVFFLIAVLLMSLLLPFGFWMGARSADKEYDDWARTSSPGDSIIVSGKIKEKVSQTGIGDWSYSFRFEGCEAGFVSEKDIGDEGQYVIVKIQKDQFGIPEVKSAQSMPITIGPNVCCCCLSGTVFLLGGI